MHETVLHPIGATVTDLQVADADDDAVDRLRHLLADHGVVALPDQRVDDTGFVGFLRRFGELTFTVGETPVEGFPDLKLPVPVITK